MAVDFRSAFENLNERERKLVGLMGVVLAFIVIVLPFYLMTSSISEIEDENNEIVSVLRDLQRSQGTLAQREAERAAAAQRYVNPAPPLGSFIEARAGEQELTLREVNDQPEKEIGQFRRRNVRATMPNVQLRPVVKMLTSIENSRFPVAVERLQIEHFRNGDNYNVQLGVIAYDQSRPAPTEGAEEAGAMRAGRRRAGPPAP